MEKPGTTQNAMMLTPRNYSWPARAESISHKQAWAQSARDVIRTAHDLYRTISESPGVFGHLQSKTQSIIATLIAVSNITEAYSNEGRLDSSTRNELRCLAEVCKGSLRQLESVRCGLRSWQTQKKRLDEVKSIVDALGNQTQELERINKRTRESVIELSLVKKYVSESRHTRRRSYDFKDLGLGSIPSLIPRPRPRIPRPGEATSLTSTRLHASRTRVLHMLEIAFGERKGQVIDLPGRVFGIPSQLRRLLASFMKASRVLLLATERGIVMDMMISLENGANVDTRNCRGDTSLILAIRRSNKAMVQLLLQHKADPNKPSKSPPISPVRLAIEAQNLDILTLLLEHGANIDEFSAEDRMTPLQWAVHQKYSKVVSMLLDCGADMHLRTMDNHGETALCMAVARASTDIVQELLDHSANVNQESYPIESPYTPLSLAARRGDMGLINLLFRYGANANQPASVFQLPLFIAVKEDFYHVAELLLSYGASQDLWEHGSRPVSPLLAAVASDNLRMTQLLLSHRKNTLISSLVYSTAINNPSVDVLSALLKYQPRAELSELIDKAVQLGREDVLQLLLHNGVDIIPGKNMAVFLAVKQGNLSLLKLLVQHGANVNTRAPMASENGVLLGRETAVWLAAAGGHFKVLEFLLEHGGKVDQLVSPRKCSTHRPRECLFANTKVPDCNAVQISVAHGHKKCVKLLIQRGASLEDWLRRDRAKGQWCTDLLDAHAQQRLLHFTLEQPYLLVARAELLLNMGFSINIKGSGGQTALHVASRPDLRRSPSDTLRVAKLLFMEGADVNAQDDYELTPLHIAIAAKDPEPEVVQLLLTHGADVNAQDFRGWTPLHYAAELANEQSWNLLSQAGARSNIADIEGRSALQVKEAPEGSTGPSGLIYQRRWSGRIRTVSFGYLGSY